MRSADIRDLEHEVGMGCYARLVALGIVRAAIEQGDPLADWPSPREVALPRGTVEMLMDEDRSR
ncbi:MAG TPA: hypothetical protein VFS44_01825 [Gemmatimonadaceae bacterium]|nr:hypothetical protein [Gemmatimonadaceae bacterium]